MDREMDQLLAEGHRRVDPLTRVKNNVPRR